MTSTITTSGAQGYFRRTSSEPPLADDRPPYSPYSAPSFEITNIDRLQAVHYLILKHFQTVDPLTLLRVSRDHYKSTIPLLYRTIALRDDMVESFFHGMLDLTNERFKRGEGKLHAIKQIKTLDLQDAKSAMALVEQCKKFGRTKSSLDVKGLTPFEGVKHRRLEWLVFRGYMVSQLGSDYSPTSDDDDDKPSEVGKVPDGPFINAITKYICGTIETFCIEWGGGYTYDHSSLREDDRVKVQFQLDGDFLEDKETMLKLRINNVWRLYEKLYHVNKKNLIFTLKRFDKNQVEKALKKNEKRLDEQRNYARTYYEASEEFRMKRKEWYNDFKECWKFQAKEQDLLCRCNGKMFHEKASSGYRNWKDPDWAKNKYRSFSYDNAYQPHRSIKYGCQCGECCDSDSECGSVLEGWDPVKRRVVCGDEPERLLGGPDPDLALNW
ncbi:hypothetical protein V865_004476 [Kwoniella europaea PYCC6329]|uniref:F-box domain-containing protein n=1 Tax=Kwoniella europaea PYCC6329 TaxID=1423913 RepID=A0AAX4KIM8_9TREE